MMIDRIFVRMFIFFFLMIVQSVFLIVTIESSSSSSSSSFLSASSLLVRQQRNNNKNSITENSNYRSILGDPQMKWDMKNGNGPRMELFFYNLCSKAGYSNMSVLPEETDSFSTSSDVIYGFGIVERIESDDCSKECLDRYWCLAWTAYPLASSSSSSSLQQQQQQIKKYACELKDNSLVQELPNVLKPIDYQPKRGNCGYASINADCKTSSQGSIKPADQYNVTTFEQCRDYMLKNCKNCNYISFSASGNECSWYIHCDLNDMSGTTDSCWSAAVKQPSMPLLSGKREYHINQQLPSPRYGNCIVNGTQTVSENDNSISNNKIDLDIDDEWFAVRKEQMLGEKCKMIHNHDNDENNKNNYKKTSSYFWTLMSQNGNAPTSLGSADECLPFCYSSISGYPPAVNSSITHCNNINSSTKNKKHALNFNGKPMNQAKIMTGFTDPSSPDLIGNFNWTFQLDSNLAVPESDFPKDQDLGIWSWRYDTTLKKGITRIYQRVSGLYPWICTYFGVDSAKGIKGNQAYDGRGMMIENPIIGTDFIVRFFLNITKDNTGGSSWYLLNSEACWDQVTGENCHPYGDTNRMVHNQVLLDYGSHDMCTVEDRGHCPLYHIHRNGSKVHRDDKQNFPYSAYKQYCCPCTSCSVCVEENLKCCDSVSNSNGQSIYKIAPDPIWAYYGFPENATDGYIGDPKMHELHVGTLWEQIWFPCKASEPIEIVTLNIGPETGLLDDSTGGDTEYFISDFDVLVPVAQSTTIKLNTPEKVDPDSMFLEYLQTKYE